MKKINLLLAALTLTMGCFNPAFTSIPSSDRHHKGAGFFVLGYAPIRRELLEIQRGTQVLIELECNESPEDENIRGKWDKIERCHDGVWIHLGRLNNRFVHFRDIEKIWILSDQAGR